MSQEVVWALAALQGAVLVAQLFILGAAQRERRATRRLLAALGERPIEALLAQTGDQIQAFSHQLRNLHDKLEGQNEFLLGCLTRTGMVKFDAFPDMGGQLSFALALLDSRGDGVLLRSLHGRTESTIAAKLVKEGQAEGRLLAEEAQALAEALRVS